MPIYEYRCPACGRVDEAVKSVEKMDEAPLCRDCVEHPMERIMSLPRAPLFRMHGINAGKAYNTHADGSGRRLLGEAAS